MNAVRKWVGFSLAVCVAALIWCSYLWYSGSNAGIEAVNDPDELQALVSLGDQFVDVPQRLVVKWQGTWDQVGEKDPYQAAENLVQSLDLPQVEQIMEDGHTTYRVVDAKNGVNIRFNWQEISAHQSYIIVQLEAAGEDKVDALTDLQTVYGHKMRESGIEAVWNASLQGTVKGEHNANATMERIEGDFMGALDATKAETYEDATTVSNAYEVPSLESRVSSGGKWLNMQVAVHEDSVSGSSRVTIGLPMITIEY